MKKKIPSTPVELIQGFPGMRQAFGLLERCIRGIGLWRRPMRNAGGDYPEMVFRDFIYWLCKANRPIELGEQGPYDERYFRENRRIVARLPQGFRPTSAVSLGAAGDLLKADGMEHSKDLLWADVAPLLFDQDISYANMESPLAPGSPVKPVFDPSETPNMGCSRAEYEAMKGHGGKVFTVMQTANNHALDGGADGVEVTLKQLELDGILSLGTHWDGAGQGQGRVIERNGIRVGFACATYGLNGKRAPIGKEYLVDVARFPPVKGEPDLSLVKRQIDWCRGERCDFIIVALHWGFEFEFFPRRRQVELAHELVELGADAIIGHHPHVVQPLEYYRPRRDESRIAVIAYSLGNATWAFPAPHIALSAILNLRLVKGRLGGVDRTYVETANITPVYYSRAGPADAEGVRIRRLHTEACEPTAEGWVADVAAMKRFADLVFGPRDAGCM